MLGYDSKGDLVEAAFWWPLLFVLASCSDETNEAIIAVAMTWDFDYVFFGKLVQAGYTLAKAEQSVSAAYATDQATYTSSCVSGTLTDLWRRRAAIVSWAAGAVDSIFALLSLCSSCLSLSSLAAPVAELSPFS